MHYFLKRLCSCLLLISVASLDAAAEVDWDPKPLEGDLILPMPGGAFMHFRPIKLKIGDGPWAHIV